MDPLQKVVYAVAALFLVLLAVGLVLPGESRFEVSTTIAAPPATVFALVNDPRRRQLWAPLAAADPNARVDFSGPRRGVGATVTWNGPVVGSGTETITASNAYSRVESRLNAGEPGEASSWFALRPVLGGTEVSRGFEHDYGLNIVGRYAGLVLTGVIRRDYENSLESLRTVAENLPAADFGDLEIEQLRIEPQRIAYVSTSSPPNAAAMSASLGEAYGEVLDFIDRKGLAVAGAPLSITRAFDGAELRYDAGIPVRGNAGVATDGRVRLGETYGGEVIRVRHAGSYERLSDTHRRITAYLAATGIARNGDAWESYLSDPAETEESKLVTYVYYPIADRG